MEAVIWQSVAATAVAIVVGIYAATRRDVVLLPLVALIGAVVFWTDAGKGVHADGGGYTTTHAILRNITVDSPNADRSHLAFSGVGLLQIHDFQVVGNRTAIDLDNAFGGPVSNGTVELHLPSPASAYGGFQAGVKVKQGGVTLTNPQIDALGVLP